MFISFLKSTPNEKTKRVAKKKISLINAPDDKIFWICDGRPVKNIEELHGALKEMDSDVFKHHVNSEKNDFAKWTKEVLNDLHLAREMKRSRTLATLTKKVETRLKSLE